MYSVIVNYMLAYEESLVEFSSLSANYEGIFVENASGLQDEFYNLDKF